MKEDEIKDTESTITVGQFKDIEQKLIDVLYNCKELEIDFDNTRETIHHGECPVTDGPKKECVGEYDKFNNRFEIIKDNILNINSSISRMYIHMEALRKFFSWWNKKWGEENE